MNELMMHVLDPEDIDPSLCSHMIFAFVKIKDSEISFDTNFQYEVLFPEHFNYGRTPPKLILKGKHGFYCDCFFQKV